LIPIQRLNFHVKGCVFVKGEGWEVRTFQIIMFKLQIASDLHIEFKGGRLDTVEEKRAYFREIVNPCGKYLALLGDIGCPGGGSVAVEELYREFIHEMSNCFEAVLVVAGNHEYYVSTHPEYIQSQSEIQPFVLDRTVTSIKKKIEAICSEKPNVFFLDKKSIEIEGVLFIGATLWSSIPDENAANVEQSMNDYRLVYLPTEEGKSEDGWKFRKVRVKDTLSWHHEEVEFIFSEILRAKEMGKKAVVLTHHTPLMTGTSHPKYDGDPMNCAFSTDLSALLKSDMCQSTLTHWCFGHTHYNGFQTVGNIQLITNQRGYADVDWESEQKDGEPYHNDGIVYIQN
jgi:hypothetical protein